jgi:hypothetical protein
MNSNQYNQGRNDAQQGKGMANTNGMHHQARESYVAGYNKNK